MDRRELANLLFPEGEFSLEEYETERYPKRNLPEGAAVTRLAPSPTGFIHLGNLYGAMVDERLAHLSGGKFLLRIEDTDDKRKVEGSVELILSSLRYFGLEFDEGATETGERGEYGPYYQSQRAPLYHCVARELVAAGRAYPCFCTEEELEEIRQRQEEAKVNTGYYGEFATDRDLSPEEAAKRVKAGDEWVLRLRSEGDPEKSFSIEDGIRGTLVQPENFQDVVLLKTNGIPTYHFAHVVDDHFMRVTHVVRGEEWISTLPIHYELFTALGWELPVFCHTAHLMKQDGETKRKLSKRKDPELSLGYYREMGYFPEALREYLMTLINSNYEEWRAENPETNFEEFPFSLDKMGKSGALFDVNKLDDVSKDVLSRMTGSEIRERLYAWAVEENPSAARLIGENSEKTERVLDIGRAGAKPRKDLVYAKQIFEFISYIYDEGFAVVDSLPENVSSEEACRLLQRYLEEYNPSDDSSTWFDGVRNLAVEQGYAAKPKDYKKNPTDYKGHVGDVSAVLRLALVGRKTSPDLWSIQQILGEEKLRERVESFLARLKV